MFEFLTQEAVRTIVDSSLKAKQERTEAVLVAQLIEVILKNNTQLLQDSSINFSSFQELAHDFYKKRPCKPQSIGHTPPFSEASRSIIFTTQKQAEYKNTFATSLDLLNNSIYVVSQNPRLMREPVYLFIVETYHNTKKYSH